MLIRQGNLLIRQWTSLIILEDLVHKTGDLAHKTGDLALKIGDLDHKTGDLAHKTVELADKTGDKIGVQAKKWEGVEAPTPRSPNDCARWNTKDKNMIKALSTRKSKSTMREHAAVEGGRKRGEARDRTCSRWCISAALCADAR